MYELLSGCYCYGSSKQYYCSEMVCIIDVVLWTSSGGSLHSAWSFPNMCGSAGSGTSTWERRGRDFWLGDLWQGLHVGGTVAGTSCLRDCGSDFLLEVVGRVLLVEVCGKAFPVEGLGKKFLW